MAESALYVAPDGPGADLVTAREALATWLMARHRGARLCLAGHPQALMAIGWLGIDWEDTVSCPPSPDLLRGRLKLESRSDGAYLADSEPVELEGETVDPGPIRVLDADGLPTSGAVAVLLTGRQASAVGGGGGWHELAVGPRWRDRGRRSMAAAELLLARRLELAAPDFSWLGPLQGGQRQLEDLSRGGYLSEAVLACLAETTWRGRDGRCHQTRAELLMFFDGQGLLQEPVQFDPERLELRQHAFLSELTPSELWERSLPFWPAGVLPDELSEQNVMDLEALALLYGDEMRRLGDFPARVGFYFQAPPRRPVAPELVERLSRPGEWDLQTLSEQLSGLPPEQAGELEAAVLGAPAAPAELAELLLLLGRDRVLPRLS